MKCEITRQDIDKIAEETLADLIAKLRDVFPFPPEGEGWTLPEIVASPEMCLEIMIELCKQKKLTGQAPQQGGEGCRLN